MKTMVCDMCGMVAEKDVPVQRYAVAMRLIESTDENDSNFSDEITGDIDFCRDCLIELTAKMNQEDV